MKATPSQRALFREKLTAPIKEIYEEEFHIPGHRKVHQALLRKGMKCSLGLIRQICKENNIYSCPLKRKQFKPQTTDSKHSNHVNNNIIDRNFEADKPNMKLLADITYIKTKDGFVYLSAILDLHSRRVLAWVVEPHMKAQLVIDTLKQALKKCRGNIPKEIMGKTENRMAEPVRCF